MAVYKFRVTFEDFEDVTRDIEIRSNQTFDDFHRVILQSIGFEVVPGASFFMSDDNWKKGQEISAGEKTFVKDGEEKALPLTKKARLNEFIIDPHQKIYFIADVKGEWTFYLELLKIIPDQPGALYPRVVKTVGDAPKQYGASALGKASTEFDFFDESGIDVPEEGDEIDGHEEKTEGETDADDEHEADGEMEFGVDDMEEH